MTRRTISFIDSAGQSYKTPEFNGDKEEFEKMGSADSCDKNWPEIESEFLNVKTLKEFSDASIKAQRFYHSSIAGQSVLPIMPATNIIRAGTELRMIADNILIDEH